MGDSTHLLVAQGSPLKATSPRNSHSGRDVPTVRSSKKKDSHHKGSTTDEDHHHHDNGLEQHDSHSKSNPLKRAGKKLKKSNHLDRRGSEVRTPNPLFGTKSSALGPHLTTTPTTSDEELPETTSTISGHSVRWKEKDDIAYIPSKKEEEERRLAAAAANAAAVPALSEWKREALKNRGLVSPGSGSTENSPRGGTEASSGSESGGGGDADDVDGLSSHLSKKLDLATNQDLYETQGHSTEADNINSSDSPSCRKKKEKKKKKSKSKKPEGGSSNATDPGSTADSSESASDPDVESPKGAQPTTGPGSRDWKRLALLNNGVIRGNNAATTPNTTTNSGISTASAATSASATAAANKFAAAARRASFSSGQNHAAKTLASPSTVNERAAAAAAAAAAATPATASTLHMSHSNDSSPVSSNNSSPSGSPSGKKLRSGKTLARSWSFNRKLNKDADGKKASHSARYITGTLRGARSPYAEEAEDNSDEASEHNGDASSAHYQNVTSGNATISTPPKSRRPANPFDGNASERRETAWKRRALTNRGVVGEGSAGAQQKPFSRLSVLLTLVEEQEKAAILADLKDSLPTATAKTKTTTTTTATNTSTLTSTSSTTATTQLSSSASTTTQSQTLPGNSSSLATTPAEKERERRQALRASRLKTTKKVTLETLAEISADLDSKRQELLRLTEMNEDTEAAVLALFCTIFAYNRAFEETTEPLMATTATTSSTSTSTSTSSGGGGGAPASPSTKTLRSLVTSKHT
eukprot:TRINITY_DN5613_c2_g1_i1.p1 TRINITY_DN5613_c2_g1~~TRINITY_DN5613_c2_g1_i1.p1  ORF type:complete len:757 (+),score=213.34 TRINITY_DN5613_c2_g1_i1:206-2476(+)